MDEIIRKKKVDEDWKRQAAMEKAKIAHENDEEEQDDQQEPNEPSFQHIISMIANQILFQLGAMPNPMTGQRATDLEGARFSMELMRVLAEKTKGNLSQEEQKYMVQVLYQLQMQFARHASGMMSKNSHNI